MKAHQKGGDGMKEKWCNFLAEKKKKSGSSSFALPLLFEQDQEKLGRGVRGGPLAKGELLHNETGVPAQSWSKVGKKLGRNNGGNMARRREDWLVSMGVIGKGGGGGQPKFCVQRKNGWVRHLVGLTRGILWKRVALSERSLVGRRKTV